MEKGRIIVEAIWDKIGAIIGAIITALGGLYLHDRKTTHDRLVKLESGITQNKIDIEVIEVKFSELKADTVEIKESQKAIINLLTKRKR